MSRAQQRKRSPPRDDPGGRPLLAGLSILLVITGITKSTEWAGPFLIVLGVLLAILYAFHSRVRGVKIFDKIQLPIAADREGEPEDAPIELERRAGAGKGRPMSLQEIDEATRNPATDRQRYR